MEFECDACGIKIHHNPVKRDQTMPSGWRMHEIQGRKILICSSCGSPAAFIGKGLAPILKAG